MSDTGTLQSGFTTSNALSFFIPSLIFEVLALTAVGLRIYAKILIKRKFELHDYLVFAAMVFGVGFFANALAAEDPGVMGLHVWQANPDQFERSQKGFWSSLWIWITATTLVKLSILHLYTHIFVVKWYKRVAYSIALVTVLFWCSYILVALLICRPISKNWDPDEPGHCGSTVAQEIASASINMALDFAITITPLPVLWGLKMSALKKIVVSCMIGLGLCICAMNAARVAIEAIYADSSDWTWDVSYITMFAALEICIGIIVACVPLLGPIFFKGTKLSSSKESSLDSRSRFLRSNDRYRVEVSANGT